MDEDAVWKALANPVRRALLDLLRAGPRTTGSLADEFGELTRFAVMQHLRVLEEAELVVVRRSGRERYNYLNPVPIQRVYDRWVSRYMQPWTEALVSMRALLEDEARGRRAYRKRNAKEFHECDVAASGSRGIDPHRCSRAACVG